MLRPAFLTLAAALLAACTNAATDPAATRAEPAPLAAGALAAPQGVCWASDRIPALTETVFVAVPGQTGLQPRDQMVRPAEDRLFAVPCPEQIDADLVASLQRALAARGLYDGPVSGGWDARTADAVRRYQAPLGLDSGVLSLQAAQMLGLVPVGREQL